MEQLWTMLEITAYTAGYESTQKYADDPLYGITYSGARAKEGRTVAAGTDIPLGTRIFIPALGEQANGGIYVVEDRGGAISNAHLDIYTDDLQRALDWGRQHLEVLIWLASSEVARIKQLIESDRWKWKDKAAIHKLFP